MHSKGMQQLKTSNSGSLMDAECFIKVNFQYSIELWVSIFGNVRQDNLEWGNLECGTFFSSFLGTNTIRHALVL